MERIYAALSKQIYQELMRIDIAGALSSDIARARSRITAMLRAARARTLVWIRSDYLPEFEKAISQTVASMRMMKEQERRKLNIASIKAQKSAELLALFDRALGSIKSQAEKYFSLAIFASNEIADLQAFDFMEENEEWIRRLKNRAWKQALSQGSIAAKIKERLAEQIIDGIIEIKGRHYKASYYSKLVARTELRRAQSDAVKRVCRSYDHDLVEISDHGTVCEECAPYEGKVYSLNGSTPGYETLDEEPPWHPNCQHHMLPVSEIALELRKERGEA